MRKRDMLRVGAVVLTLFLLSPKSSAQVELNVGADLMSRYVWRGTDFSGSPSIQPYLEMSAGNFVLGAWGAYTTNLPGAQEADLNAGYSFGDVFGITLTDYYFPSDDTLSVKYFDFDENHSLEISGTLTIDKFSLLVGKFFAGADDKSLYLEAGYDFGIGNVFVGAGDEVYTTDGDFGIVNIGIGTSKDIKFTDYFTLPLSGSIILNPESESLFLVVGVSF